VSLKTKLTWETGKLQNDNYLSFQDNTWQKQYVVKSLVWGKSYGHLQKCGYDKTLGCWLENLELHVSYFEV